jgi:hypothetical protein
MSSEATAVATKTIHTPMCTHCGRLAKHFERTNELRGSVLYVGLTWQCDCGRRITQQSEDDVEGNVSILDDDRVTL